MLRASWAEIFNKERAEQEHIANELCEKFRMEYERMAHTVIWLPDEVFKELKRYSLMDKFKNRIEIGKYVLISEKHNEEKKISLMVNRKYEWATPDAKSDKQFLQWIWSRLHQVFGEREGADHMIRLDEIIARMPGNKRLDVVDEGKWDIYRKGKLVHSDE